MPGMSRESVSREARPANLIVLPAPLSLNQFAGKQQLQTSGRAGYIQLWLQRQLDGLLDRCIDELYYVS